MNPELERKLRYLRLSGMAATFSQFIATVDKRFFGLCEMA